jgi:hypothetical protein
MAETHGGPQSEHGETRAEVTNEYQQLVPATNEAVATSRPDASGAEASSLPVDLKAKLPEIRAALENAANSAETQPSEKDRLHRITAAFDRAKDHMHDHAGIYQFAADTGLTVLAELAGTPGLVEIMRFAVDEWYTHHANEGRMLTP